MTSGEAESADRTERAGQRVPRPDPDVIARRIDAGTVLINLRNNRIYELNATGSRIWELLVAGQGVAQIQAAHEQEFEVGTAEAADAIAETLANLSREGLVREDHR